MRSLVPEIFRRQTDEESMSQESKFNEEVSIKNAPNLTNQVMVNIRCDRTRFIFEVRKEKRWQLLDHTGDFEINHFCHLIKSVH